MYGGECELPHVKRPDPRTIRTKAEIEAAMIRLLQTVDYGNITVDRILSESQYSRSAFYANYKSKDDCFMHILDEESHRFVTYFLQSIRKFESRTSDRESKELTIATDYFTHIYTNRVLYSLILRDSQHNQDWRLYFLDHAEIEFSRLLRVIPISEEMKEENADIKLYHYTSFHRFIAAIKYWIDNDFYSSPETFAKYYVNLRKFDIIWDKEIYN